MSFKGFQKVLLLMVLGRSSRFLMRSGLRAYSLVCCLCVYSDKSDDEQASLGECGGDYRPSNSQVINTGIYSSPHFAQEMHDIAFMQVIGHVHKALILSHLHCLILGSTDATIQCCSELFMLRTVCSQRHGLNLAQYCDLTVQHRLTEGIQRLNIC